MTVSRLIPKNSHYFSNKLICLNILNELTSSHSVSGAANLNSFLPALSINEDFLKCFVHNILCSEYNCS